MPFCPTCRYEYRPGIETCADCQTALVDVLPEPHEPVHPSGSDVQVARLGSLAMAQMWAGLLDEEGIASRLQPAGMGDTLLVPGQAHWEIRVAAIDAPRALELLPGGQAVATEDDEPAEDEPAEDEPGYEGPAAEPSGNSYGMRILILAVAVGIALVLIFFGARWLS